MMRLIIILLAFFTISTATAQDADFSNRLLTRVYNNPALASEFKGMVQYSAYYRRQWSSLGSEFPFQYSAAAAYKKWTWNEGNEFTALITLSSETAPGNSFVQNEIAFGGSYKKLLNEGYGNSQFLAIGFTNGLNQDRSNWDGLWFGNQFDYELGRPNLNLSSGEDFSDVLGSVNYVDLNFGMSYQIYASSFSLNANFAWHHLNRPNVSFIPNRPIQREYKWVGNISLNINTSEDFYIVLSPLYSKQSEAQILSTKVGLAFDSYDSYNINFGISLIPKLVKNLSGLGLESIGFQVFMERGGLRFDVGYDATFSSLAPFNGGRGGFEFGLTYTVKGKRNNYYSSFEHNLHVL